jgi:uncharacterized protein YbaR (Trm112 family)/ubiquinone/menaquinone biosynthesis C-methylase UbiE
MKEIFLEYVACPSCRGSLHLGGGRVNGIAGEIRSGTLECERCRTEYPIRNYIPRFVTPVDGAAPFELELKLRARTQLDSFNRTSMTHERFYRSTRWHGEFAGQRVLEAGCGAGRFTEIALEEGCELFSFDWSDAVEACLDNNGLGTSWHVFQADLHCLPLKTALFDRVFCLDVLQRCPSPSAAFNALLPFLRPGGAIAIDVYESSLTEYAQPRFWLRLITSRMPLAMTYPIVQRAVPRLLPAKRWLQRHTALGKQLAGMIPILCYAGALPISEEQLVDWSIRDTFDALSPRYENRATGDMVRDWFQRAGFADAIVEHADGLIVGRGRKPGVPTCLRSWAAGEHTVRAMVEDLAGSSGPSAVGC